VWSQWAALTLSSGHPLLWGRPQGVYLLRFLFISTYVYWSIWSRLVNESCLFLLSLHSHSVPCFYQKETKMAPSPTIAPVFLQALRELGWAGATCNIQVDPQGRLGLCLPPSSLATTDIVCDIFILLLTIVSLLLVMFLVQKGAFLEMLLVCLQTCLSVRFFFFSTVRLFACWTVGKKK
jgi:hypothetical protein